MQPYRSVTDNRIRGRFAHLAVFSNLEKPLIFQVLVDGAVQRVEYEAFLTICFGCGKYGYVKDLCPMLVVHQTLESPSEVVNIGSNATTGGAVEETGLKFNPWMLVERRSRRGLMNARGNARVNNGAKFRKESLSSRFSALKKVRETSDNHAVSAGDSLSVKGAGINSKGVVGFSTRVKDKSLREMKDLGRLDFGLAVEPAKQISSGQAANGKFGKVLEKRPLISNATTQISNEDFNIDDFVSNSNLNFGVAGSSHHFSSSKDMVLDNVVRGSGGTPVPIFDGVLDLEKHSAISFKDTSHKKEKITSISLSRKRLGNRISISKERHGGRDSNGRSSRKASNALCGRGSHFKASENSRVSLAESMEEMAKFISNSNISNDLNSDSDDAALISDGDTEYSIDILSLLKTIVSGSKADNIIAKLGFPCSHRVEAIGFSRGIWIVFISFVYGSPNRQKRKDLWDILKCSIPMGNYPWVAIGDFNAILSFSEKLGGMFKGRQCPFFGDFMDKAKLHDLGYRGPPLLGTGVCFLRGLIRIWKMKLGSSTFLIVWSRISQKLWISQKARYDWLHLGDRNTKFFHACMLCQRKNSRITVTNEEINGALFDMSPLKAPGRDGFHAVRSIFNGDTIDVDMNNTLIVLIPKVDSPEDFAQYRPISLYSVLYKLVMKVIVNRFKIIFSKMIGPEQVVFIAGRNITDNVIITQEVIHYMRSSSKRKWMTIKIDLEKAYDRVRWDFINASLQAVGVDVTVVKSISSLFGFQKVQNFGHYFGVPLFHKRVTNITMHFVVEKVRGKLQSWDVKRLSIAGRITLAQSILMSIPSYFM
ncbi:hypothetical protein Gorai_008042, partial [Gossypium raimondii]|nr:hypothetical protein [Gossypium raimondii]